MLKTLNQQGNTTQGTLDGTLHTYFSDFFTTAQKSHTQPYTNTSGLCLKLGIPEMHLAYH